MSFTVVDMASFDNKVTSNLEVVFLIDNNGSGNTTYHHIDIKRFTIWIGRRTLYATVKAEPLSISIYVDKGKPGFTVKWMAWLSWWTAIREHAYHEKDGVSYLRLEFSGFVRTLYNWLFGGTHIIAACNELKVVFPWNQTRTIEFQPPEICYDDGDFNTLIQPLVLMMLFIVLVVSCFLLS